MYGVAAGEPNLAILMRHRAVLFGLIGSFMLLAVFRPALRTSAIVGGFVSVASFLYFAAAVGSYNAQIGRVVAVDIVVLVCLVVAAIAHVFMLRGTSAISINADGKRICCWWAAAAMLIVGLYSAVGVLQAGSIFVGERALQNLRFWGSITVFSLVGCALIIFFALRLKRAAPRQ